MHFGFAQYKQRGFAQVYILMGLIILALAAAGAYYFGKQTSSPVTSPANTSQNQNPIISSPTSQPTTSPNEITNWKTYTNNKFGYSIKYPTNWTAQQTSSDATAINSPDFATHPTTGAIEKGANLVIWPNKNPPVTSLDFSVLSKQPLKLNSLEGTIYEVSGAGINGKAKIVSIKKSDKYYDLEFYYDQSRNTEFEAIFDQILSTFKFTQ